MKTWISFPRVEGVPPLRLVSDMFEAHLESVLEGLEPAANVCPV